jgi:hypothetical protein
MSEAPPKHEPEIVLARMYRSKWDNENNENLPVLVWPLELFAFDGSVTIWERVGQHGSAALGRLIATTRPATAAEAAAAIRQWRSEGPDRSEAEWPLILRRRCPPWHVVQSAHEAQRRRWREGGSPG